jgi:hypothetical protein
MAMSGVFDHGAGAGEQMVVQMRIKTRFDDENLGHWCFIFLRGR